jgi:hypothetical protein
MVTHEVERSQSKYSSIFWGLLLIAGGLLALAQNQGYLIDQQPMLWTGVFAAVSVLALVFYFLSGIQHWGILIPAGVFGGLALVTFQAGRGVENPAVAAPLFIGIGLPFVVAYFLNRAQNWWALIPAGVMAFLTYVLLVVETIGGEAVGAGMFFILGTTFGLVYLSRREVWAAIVAYVMFVLGMVVLASLGSRPELAGSMMLFATALPFLLVYLRSPEQNWWALIPSGILTSSGVTAFLVLLPGLASGSLNEQVARAIMYLGIAATFALIGLRHHKSWALFVAALALLAAVVSGIASQFQQYWPMLLILAGIFLLYQALRSRSA